ncbi:MAG: hypothetical protein MK108_14950 [Mariniblastus sp.]|nr:hypothetical protein [Mariniblastus sp.]
MNRFLSLTMTAVFSLGLATSFAGELETKNLPETAHTKTAAPIPHCEVPCGIYADQMRFEMMLEDTKTIAKAITSLQEYCDGFKDGPPNAKTVNQMTRWVTTKESHATNTQHIMAQYFLTQRIKPDHKMYAQQLAAAHKVMVAAMKCKQDPVDETPAALKAAILDFYRAYEGKEPQLHDEK